MIRDSVAATGGALMGWILDWFADSFAQSFSSSVGRNRPAWVDLAVYLGCLLLFGLVGIGFGLGSH